MRSAGREEVFFKADDTEAGVFGKPLSNQRSLLQADQEPIACPKPRPDFYARTLRAAEN